MKTATITYTDDRALPPSNLGRFNLTLGWYEDANGVVIISESGKAALDTYLHTLSVFEGSTKPRSGGIRGWTFPPRPW